MSRNNSSKAEKVTAGSLVESVTGMVSTVLGRDRNPVDQRSFNKFVTILAKYDLDESTKNEEIVKALYKDWASKFELLKSEFNSAWDFFCSLERQLTGWYAVSPNQAAWKAVACERGGYSFAACIMKNHHRDAPLSDKSLSVSFGLNGPVAGIGDERWIGWQGVPGDSLVGLPLHPKMSPRDQAKGAMSLIERISNTKLVFRLNHHKIAQQSATYPLSMLDHHSLKGLCQRLFMALNNDILADLRLPPASSEQLQLSDGGAN